MQLIDEAPPVSGMIVRAGRLADVACLASCDAHGRWSEQAFAAELRTVWSHVWVLDLHGTLCGFLVAWRISDEVQLLNIAVATTYRRQGLGGFLLRRLTQQARSWGAARLVLEVRRDNVAARHLYSQHGFTAVGLRKGYYEDTGEDAVLMELVI